MIIKLSKIKTEEVHGGTTFKKPLITQTEENGRVGTFNYAWLEKGMEVTPHKHPDGLEYYLFLEGEGEMLVGERWFVVTKDDFIIVPQNNFHSVKNNKEKRLVFITLRTIL